MNKIARYADVIRLLLVEQSSEDAERLTSILRNAGISVRATQVRNAAELDAQIDTQPPDLILAHYNPSLGFANVVQAASRGARDIPVIANLDMFDEEHITLALRAGASGAAARARGDILVAVVRRELESLNMRRSVRRLEAALRESERRCDALLESAREPIAYVHEGMHVRANQAYVDIFGYSDFAEIEGLSILDLIAPESTETFRTALRDLTKSDPPGSSVKIKARRADGAMFEAVMEFAEASFEGEACQQIVLRQQGVNVELTREIDVLRSRDLVTDLYSRQHGLGELERMVSAASTGTPNQFLLLIEPDDFRKQLDVVGIGNADLLLGDMGNLLRRQLQESDLAVRFGEHTFGVLIGTRELDAVRELAQKLRVAFEEHIFEIGKHSLTVCVSVGGILIGEKNANAQTVLSQVGVALRAAHEEGGNRVNLVDPGARASASASETSALITRIENAIRDNTFTLYYQPMISLHGLEGEFYEVFVRMPGEKSEIAANAFLPLAEENGLLPAIDRCVIATAIRALAEREEAGRPTVLFVKLSAASLEELTLVPWIAQQLKQLRVRGDSLILEMPESKVVTHLKPARAFVADLKLLHCGFALEQFGAGINSFQLLKHIDAGYLKIDRSYMIGLPKSKENQDLVRRFCNQAHQAGKLVVAEFVEDAASMSILFTCGVNFVQGNFLSEPEKIFAAG